MHRVDDPLLTLVLGLLQPFGTDHVVLEQVQLRLEPLLLGTCFLLEGWLKTHAEHPLLALGSRLHLWLELLLVILGDRQVRAVQEFLEHFHVRGTH